jgi:hypothetical protein
LLSTAPAQRLVKGPGPGQVRDAERHETDSLLHRRDHASPKGGLAACRGFRCRACLTSFPAQSILHGAGLNYLDLVSVDNEDMASSAGIARTRSRIASAAVEAARSSSCAGLAQLLSSQPRDDSALQPYSDPPQPDPHHRSRLTSPISDPPAENHRERIARGSNARFCRCADVCRSCMRCAGVNGTGVGRPGGVSTETCRRAWTSTQHAARRSATPGANELQVRPA